MGEVVRMPQRRDLLGGVTEPMVAAKQLASHFGVCESTIRRWRRGGMPSIKHPRGARRYRISECERWLREMAS